MDIVERLTLEAAQADSVLACEHRHRYQFAAGLCAGQRVLDLCSGSGYGTAILADSAQQVVGVDNDAAAIDAAQVLIAHPRDNVSFETSDAVVYLRERVDGRFDDIVCFEGLEHLNELDQALALLRQHAERGLRIIASIPNGKLFGEQNPYHVTEFGYDEAMAAFRGFPRTVMVPQFLAEGSLICPFGAQQTDVTVSTEDRDEPESANHFIFCVNFEPAELERVHHGKINLNVAPIFNRWLEGLKHANAALRRENARLARERLGKAGSAAASALTAIERREIQAGAWQQQLQVARARVEELELALANAGQGPEQSASGPGGSQAVTPVSEDAITLVPLAGRMAASAPEEDPNSWEMRHRRAANVLLPWVEQTIPLAGKTVLEYGCGNAAVSCAVAERAGELIGLDIDPRWIEDAHGRVRERGLRNVTLELHAPEAIGQAVAARTGQIDVFLLYAVLEHLTVPERLQVLRLAHQVLRPDGAIVICEAPNRLIYFDHHTAQMPFFHLLPDELALEYYRRSDREEFKAAIDRAAGDGRDAALEAIARWGRGISFHELEAVFGQQLDRLVLASGYDPLLFPERPVHPEEVILARYLDRWRPDLPPGFSRYWLDLIIAREPLIKRPAVLRPWSAHTLASRGVGFTERETLNLQDADAVLWITPPHPTRRVVVAVAGTSEPMQLLVTAPELGAALGAKVPPAVGAQAFVSFALPGPAQRVSISCESACELLFVGYED